MSDMIDDKIEGLYLLISFDWLFGSCDHAGQGSLLLLLGFGHGL